MPNLNAKILAAFYAGEKEIVFTADEATVGTGTLHYINTELNEQFEIIDVRTPLIDFYDMFTDPVMDLSGAVARENFLVRHLYEQGFRPKLVILDEFSSAAPKVREAMDFLIEFTKTRSEIQVIFVKVR